MKTSLPPIPGLASLIRRHFFAGILVVVPFWVIGWILGGVIRSLLRLKTIAPAKLQPEYWVQDEWIILILNSAFLLGLLLGLTLTISLVGWVSRQFIGRKLLDLLSALINRIPVIRSIYSALDQLMRTFAGDEGTQQFNRVVYVEWPRKGLLALAFVTSPARGPHAPPGHLNIFVPTTPNPTAGFHMLVDEREVKESGMSVEEAFRTILSLGIAQPAPPKRVN
jgi:uncharacterized membrane protein